MNEQNTPVQPSNQNSAIDRKLQSDKKYYWFLVMYMVLESALGSFVNDMYSPALPGMCRFFGCTVPLGQMGLTMGMIGLALGQLILGPISDRYGRQTGTRRFAHPVYCRCCREHIFSDNSCV